MSVDYTPTTIEVRREYSITVIDGSVLPERAEAFDRWFAEAIAESFAAGQRWGAERAARRIDEQWRHRSDYDRMTVGRARRTAVRVAREAGQS
jgi:hypothetical protein